MKTSSVVWPVYWASRVEQADIELCCFPGIENYRVFECQILKNSYSWNVRERYLDENVRFNLSTKSLLHTRCQYMANMRFSFRNIAIMDLHNFFFLSHLVSFVCLLSLLIPILPILWRVIRYFPMSPSLSSIYSVNEIISKSSVPNMRPRNVQSLFLSMCSFSFDSL